MGQSKFFHPELLALMEKQTINEIRIKDKNADMFDLGLNQDEKSYEWISDYPILCYKEKKG